MYRAYTSFVIAGAKPNVLYARCSQLNRMVLSYMLPVAGLLVPARLICLVYGRVLASGRCLWERFITLRWTMFMMYFVFWFLFAKIERHEQLNVVSLWKAARFTNHSVYSHDRHTKNKWMTVPQINKNKAPRNLGWLNRKTPLLTDTPLLFSVSMFSNWRRNTKKKALTAHTTNTPVCMGWTHVRMAQMSGRDCFL